MTKKRRVLTKKKTYSKMLKKLVNNHNKNNQSKNDCFEIIFHFKFKLKIYSNKILLSHLMINSINI